jgi:hypothetical protein
MYSLSDSAFTCGSMLLQREAYSPRARHTRLQQHRLQQLQQRCNRIETHLKALSEGRTRLQQHRLQQLQQLLQSETLHAPHTPSLLPRQKKSANNEEYTRSKASKRNKTTRHTRNCKQEEEGKTASLG